MPYTTCDESSRPNYLWRTPPPLVYRPLWGSLQEHQMQGLCSLYLPALPLSSFTGLTHFFQISFQCHLFSEIFPNQSLQSYNTLTLILLFYFFPFSILYVFYLLFIACLFLQECKLHKSRLFFLQFCSPLDH